MLLVDNLVLLLSSSYITSCFDSFLSFEKINLMPLVSACALLSKFSRTLDECLLRARWVFTIDLLRWIGGCSFAFINYIGLIKPCSMSSSHSWLFFIICFHYFITFSMPEAPSCVISVVVPNYWSHLFVGSLPLSYFCVLAGNSSVSTLDVIIFSLWSISYWSSYLLF